MEGGAEILPIGLGPMLGREIMNLAGETRLRGAIREQIAHPVDLFDTAPGVNYSELDRRFLGFDANSQNKATMANFDEEQAGRWFEIVADEYGQARAAGAVLPEISAEKWAAIEKHELQHLREGVKRGLDLNKATLRAGFGYDLPPTESGRGMAYEFGVAFDDVEENMKLHPVERVAIMLAPDDPSVGDCIRAITAIRKDVVAFASRPKEAIELVGKLQKATGLNFVETMKILGRK